MPILIDTGLSPKANIGTALCVGIGKDIVKHEILSCKVLFYSKLFEKKHELTVNKQIIAKKTFA
jgi:hypothetical protein